MGLGKPTSDPTWATGGTYPADGNPWASAPVRSTPSSGKRATGYVPNTGDACDEDNAILGSHGDWIGYLDQLLEGVVTGRAVHVLDHFLKTTVDSTLWTASGANGGAVAIVDDSSAGANGSVQLSIPSTSGSAPAAVLLFDGPNLVIATDFSISMRLRASVFPLAGGNLFFAGFYGHGSDGLTCCVGLNAGANWKLFLSTSGTVDATIDLGVPYDTALHAFDIVRVGSSLTVSIDGVVRDTITNAQNFTGTQWVHQLTGGHITGVADVRIDRTSLLWYPE